MAPHQMEDFVRKFRQLWRDGFTAHLDLDCHAGQAWCGIRVQLGHPPGPGHQQQQVHPQGVRQGRRSPSDKDKKEDKQGGLPLLLYKHRLTMLMRWLKKPTLSIRLE